MDSAKVSTQVHRFRDDVAVYVARGPSGNDPKGQGLTVYMPPDDAERFARDILEAVANVRTHPKFSEAPGCTSGRQFDGRA